jgi:PAS domain S-box-containing protein
MPFRKLHGPVSAVRQWALWKQYALSIGLVLAALGLRLLLNPQLGDKVPYLTLFTVLLPLVLLVRPLPLLVAALLGCLGAFYLFVAPGFHVNGSSDWIQGGLSLAAAFAATATAYLSRRIEERLRADDAILRSFVDDSPMGKWVTGPDGKVHYANKALAQMLGRERDQIIGRPYRDLLPAAAADIERVRSGGEAQTSLEELDVPGAGTRFFEWRRFALATGGPVLVAGSAIDVTQRVLAERQALALREAEGRVERSQRMAAVGTMASGLSHDISNLLISLSSRTGALTAERGLPPQVREDLAVVVSLISHLRDLCRNLALFARDPEREGSEGVTDLSEWCPRVEKLMRASVERRTGPGQPMGITLTCDIPHQGLPLVGVAPHRLTQAVLNLALNARDAVEAAQRADPEWAPPGLIHVEARPSADGKAVTIRITDNGIGMSKEVATRSVEPFFTTKDRPASVGGAGSGLGLSLAYAICQKVGGSLEITSAPGKGTTIAMTLPAATDSGKSAQAAARLARRARGSSKSEGRRTGPRASEGKEEMT